MMRRFLIGIGLLLFTSLAEANSFVLKAKAFVDNAKLPLVYSCNGKNISPALSWENPPAGTVSFALILFAVDRPEQNANLWVLFNIPGNVKGLPDDAGKQLPSGVLIGNNHYDEIGYRGPCPPDSLEHLYVFVLYALDTTLDLPEGADFEDVASRMRDHILGKALLSVTFNH